MRRAALLSLLILAPAVLPAPAKPARQDVRPAVFAGQFYDRDPARLAAAIDGWFRAAGNPAFPPGTLRALIAPHAGYIYSGAVAAKAYNLIRGHDIDTVVIIGPAHALAFEGCSIYPSGGFATPLGAAAVDAETAAALSKATGFGYVAAAHAGEHSVEVQVPFIRRALPSARIVPIVMGRPARRTVETLARGLSAVLAGRRALVVASTDLSHYLDADEARDKDERTMGWIRAGDTVRIIRDAEARDNAMCGGAAVAAALLYAKAASPGGEIAVEILERTDSGSAGGPADRVVGYLAAAVWTPRVAAAADVVLGAEDKAALIALARKAVDTFVREGRILAPGNPAPAFRTPRGAFVTLRKEGALRGCIGYAEPVHTLWNAVLQAAVLAASEDPRFPPVRPGELAGLEIEISVLTAAREIADPRAVRAGRDGVIVEMNGRRGLLLPTVAAENGWDRDTLLAQACLKAGLPPDAWRQGARVRVFEAVVFREAGRGGSAQRPIKRP